MANLPIIHKTREDDVLECFLYPKFCYALNTDNITEAQLNEEIARYYQEIAPHTADYIWHRDALVFRPRTKQAMMLERILDNSMVIEGKFFAFRTYALMSH